MSKKDNIIRKLGNAVRAYRGVTWSPAGAIKKDWKMPPMKEKATRIRELLGSLQFDAEQQENAIKQIDGFQSFDEFNQWIKKL